MPGCLDVSGGKGDAGQAPVHLQEKEGRREKEKDRRTVGQMVSGLRGC